MMTAGCMSKTVPGHILLSKIYLARKFPSPHWKKQPDWQPISARRGFHPMCLSTAPNERMSANPKALGRGLSFTKNTKPFMSHRKPQKNRITTNNCYQSYTGDCPPYTLYLTLQLSTTLSTIITELLTLFSRKKKNSREYLNMTIFLKRRILCHKLSDILLICSRIC